MTRTREHQTSAPDVGTAFTCAATKTSGMFYEAAAFNADVSFWDVSGVADLDSMFGGAAAFNADLSAWDVASGATT